MAFFGAATCPAGRGGAMTLQTVLIVAAAIFSVGLYGALSQQVVVMVMMGLELILRIGMHYEFLYRLYFKIFNEDLGYIL